MPIDAARDPNVLELPRSARHAALLGWPFLIVGVAATVSGVSQLFTGDPKFVVYYWISIFIGLPCLSLGVARVCGRQGVVLDRGAGVIRIWARLFWHRRETQRPLAETTAVVLVRYWNPSKTEDPYLYRVALRSAAEATRDLRLEERLDEERGRAYAERVAAFLDVPTIEEKGWR